MSIFGGKTVKNSRIITIFSIITLIVVLIGAGLLIVFIPTTKIKCHEIYHMRKRILNKIEEEKKRKYRVPGYYYPVVDIWTRALKSNKYGYEATTTNETSSNINSITFATTVTSSVDLTSQIISGINSLEITSSETTSEETSPEINYISSSTTVSFSVDHSSKITSVITTSFQEVSTEIYPGIITTSVACVTISTNYTNSINIFNWNKEQEISIADFVCIPYIKFFLFDFKWFSKVECNGPEYIEGKSVTGTSGRGSAIRLALEDFISEAVKLGLISGNDAPNLIC